MEIKFLNGGSGGGGGGGTPGGLDGSVQYNNGGSFGGDATNFFWDDTSNASYLLLGSGTSPGAIRLLEGSASGTNYIALTVPTTLAANYTVTLPQFTTTLVGLSGPSSQTFTNDIIIFNVASQVLFNDNVGPYIGTGSDTTLMYRTAQTPDSLVLGLSTDSNGFIICEQADAGFDFAHALATDPTVFIHSHNQSTTQWLSLAHNGTNGILNAGTGNITFTPATLHTGQATFTSSGGGSIQFNDTTATIPLGNAGSGYPYLFYNPAQTPDTLTLGLGSLGNTFIIHQYDDSAFDFAHALQTNPTLFIHSAAQSTTQWIGLTHDGTNGVISTGAGFLNLAASGSTSQVVIPNGASNNVPGLGFVGSTTTGLMYQAGNNVMAFLMAGTEFIRMSNGSSGVTGLHTSGDLIAGGSLGGTQNAILKGPVAGTLQLGTDTVAGSQVDQTIRAPGGRAGTDTDTKGSILTIAGGIATGTGAGGDIKAKTSVPIATSSTAQTLGDRYVILGKHVALTAATATSFATIAIPTSTVSGGMVTVTVEANDGTDFQARTLRAVWSAVNKAGTITTTVSTPEETVAVSAGTLTATLTVVDNGANGINLKLDAASSLSETTLRAVSQISKNFGTGAILAG